MTYQGIKKVELFAVLLTASAALYLSIAQQSTNLQLMFSFGLLSSIVLTTTTYLTRNNNFLVMNLVYLLINLNGFINS